MSSIRCDGRIARSLLKSERTPFDIASSSRVAPKATLPSAGSCDYDIGWARYSCGDAGFSSRNADYRGKADALLEYRLSNGQLDSA